MIKLHGPLGDAGAEASGIFPVQDSFPGFFGQVRQQFSEELDRLLVPEQRVRITDFFRSCLKGD